MDEKEQIHLKVVPEPQMSEGKWVLLGGGTGKSTEIMGGLDKRAPDTFCGHCGVRLTFGLSRVRLAEYVMRCTSCGSFNEL
jgi:hypothetical protein